MINGLIKWKIIISGFDRIVTKELSDMNGKYEYYIKKKRFN